MVCVIVYSEIPIGFEMFFSAYSATILFFDLQRIIPIEGLSSSVLRISSIALR